MKNCCNLPQDVLIEILSRLSVKSLLRLKCVCKFWYSLVKNPHFISKHLEQTTLDDHHAGLLLMHHNTYTKEDGFTLFPNSTLDGPPVTLRIHSKRQCYIRIMGPCNGIFCMYDYFDNLFLWNPATKEIKDLPKSCIPPPPDLKIASDNFGFGFDPNTNDYKVIRLGQRSLVHQKEYSEYHIELYNLSSDYWRKFDFRSVPATSIFERDWPAEMYMNQVYHWWARSKDKLLIISFDMGEEVFQVTPLPEFWHIIDRGIFIVWNESLAVIRSWVCHSPTMTCIEIWKLSEYGSNAYWTKQLTVEPLPGVDKPLGLWNNSHEFILRNDDGGVVSYNPKTQTVKVLIPSARTYWTFKVVMYKESLVSIKFQPLD